MKKNFGLLINGKWLKNRETIDVFKPFDGKKISTVSCANSNQINNSIKFAHLAFKSWSKNSSFTGQGLYFSLYMTKLLIFARFCRMFISIIIIFLQTRFTNYGHI